MNTPTMDTPPEYDTVNERAITSRSRISIERNASRKKTDKKSRAQPNTARTPNKKAYATVPTIEENAQGERHQTSKKARLPAAVQRLFEDAGRREKSHNARVE